MMSLPSSLVAVPEIAPWCLADINALDAARFASFLVNEAWKLKRFLLKLAWKLGGFGCRPGRERYNSGSPWFQ